MTTHNKNKITSFLAVTGVFVGAIVVIISAARGE